MKNVFVVGLEPFNLELLRGIRGAGDYAFHPLLQYPDITRPAEWFPPFDDMLAAARAQLDDFPGTVDGIVGYWDFPTTGLVPLLCRERGLPAPSLEAVARCEHKYWSRCSQAQAMPELVPRFQAIDPFAEDPAGALELAYPFWMKPVKAHSSFLGFRIHNRRQMAAALETVREGIERIARPFNGFMAHVDAPPEVARIDGYHCIAEEIICRGQQCTLEGYVFGGEVHVYGAVDSIRSGRHRSSFARYQYPSALPRRVLARMISATRRVMQHIGYDHGAFNIEFYWDARSDRIHLLEINSRISKSHSPLFAMVDGASNQQVPVELVQGRRPHLPRRAGGHRLAAKFMLRTHEDAVVERSPGPADIATLTARYPEARVRVLAPAGTRLAHMIFQDSYSFEIAEVFLGARDRKELLAKGREAERILEFELRPLESEAA